MLLVSCGTDLKLHNCPLYDLVHVYRPADSSGQIRNVSWCKDGSWLTLVPNHGHAEIIRTKDDVRLLQTVLGVSHPTSAVFQRTTKRNLGMSTINGSILVYDIKAKSVNKRFVNTGSYVTMLDWSLKDTHLVAGSTDGQIALYSNTTNQKISVYSIPDSKSVSTVRFHVTQKPILGTASDEGVVAVWDINVGKQKMCLKPHKAPVTDLVFSSQNSNLMVSVGLDRTFQCYDTNNRTVALTVMTDHPLSAIDMAPDGFTIAVASSRGTIYIYDLREYKTPLKTIAAHSGEIKKIMYQPVSSCNTESIQIQEEKPAEILLESNTNTSVDSFAAMLNDNVFSEQDKDNEVKEKVEEIKIRSNSAAGDSFLNSIEDFGVKSELSNLGLSDSVRKWLDRKNNLRTQSANSCDSPNGKLSEVLSISNVKQSSSTPRQNNGDRVSFLQNQNLLQSNISPIVPAESITLTQEELQKTIKATVNEIVSEQMSELTDALSDYFLDLQLSFSKQFVGQENNMERLFNYYCGSAPNSNLNAQMQQLQQENEFLKNKLNELFRKYHS